MPTLFVLRHAKSDWEVAYGADIDRPLAKRGRKATRTIGRHLAETGRVPDLALTSPATRARDTLDRVLAESGLECPVTIVDAFYGGGVGSVLDELKRLEQVDTALIVGHEPTWSDLIATLTGEGVRFPTAALACIELPGGWSDIGPDTGTLAWLVRPRELEASDR